MLFKGNVKRINNPSPSSLVLKPRHCLELKSCLACMLHFKPPATDHHGPSVGHALGTPLHYHNSPVQPFLVGTELSTWRASKTQHAESRNKYLVPSLERTSRLASKPPRKTGASETKATVTDSVAYQVTSLV